MSPNKPESDAQKAKAISVKEPDNLAGTMKWVGGSRSDHWNETLANQALSTLWTAHSKDKALNRQYNAMVAALAGIEPRDELEAMIAAQLLGAHNAAMECYRRAMIKDQTFEGHRENLNQANKLSRTYAVLLDALNRHRGKGQQKVTVEHVHVHSGGQAIVGMVEAPALDNSLKTDGQPDAKQIAHAPQPAMRSPNADPELVPIASDAERPLLHGGVSPGAPKGTKNALKHGRYTAEAIARRREISELMRSMKALVRNN